MSHPHPDGHKPINPLCPDCGAETEFIVNLTEGDEDGRFITCLYQCPKCKTITIK